MTVQEFKRNYRKLTHDQKLQVQRLIMKLLEQQSKEARS
jgi:hypothetical protein